VPVQGEEADTVIKIPIDLKIDLKRHQPKNIAITLAVAAIALLLYIYIFLGPQIGRFARLLAKTSKLGHELRVARRDVANIDKLSEDIAMFKTKVDLYEKKLPAEQEIPSLLESLTKMARRSNVTILGITPVSVSQREEKEFYGRAYQEFPIVISAKSGYHELGSFLSDLENADRFMKVADLSIRSNNATPSRHNIELIVATYILLKER
jgi:type IV pilus assembly protein PilO